MTGASVRLILAALLLPALAACTAQGLGEPISTTVLTQAKGQRYLITTVNTEPNVFHVAHDGPGRPDPAAMADLVQQRNNCAYIDRLSLSDDSRKATFRGAFCQGSDFWR